MQHFNEKLMKNLLKKLMQNIKDLNIKLVEHSIHLPSRSCLAYWVEENILLALKSTKSSDIQPEETFSKHNC